MLGPRTELASSLPSFTLDFQERIYAEVGTTHTPRGKADLRSQRRLAYTS
jgi:hypothetical protein